MGEHIFPLGIAKQAIMKIDSFVTDLAEMSQEEYPDGTINEKLEYMVELATIMEASLLNMISSEIGEEEFLGENIPIDKFDEYPEIEDENLLSTEIMEIASTGISDLKSKIKSMDHFYLYHLVPKDADITVNGITSLEWQYRNDIESFKKNSDKYRDRLCNGWNIYPGKDPQSLTDEEVYNGILKFRKSNNGCNHIYFFPFPPFKQLGKNMKDVLDGKDMYRVDLVEIVDLLNEIDFGYMNSSSDNTPLTLDYYKNTSINDYFSKYNDNGTPLFATLNHLSISPVGNCIPNKYITKIDIPESLEAATAIK